MRTPKPVETKLPMYRLSICIDGGPGRSGALLEIEQPEIIDPKLLEESMRLVAIALGARQAQPQAASNSVQVDNPYLKQMREAIRVATGVPAPIPVEAAS